MHTEIIIYDEENKGTTYLVEYMISIDNHNELEPHIRFTETSEEVTGVFDLEGQRVMDDEIIEKVEEAFHRRPRRT